MSMNNLTISSLNKRFVEDLAKDYIMDIFKYRFVDNSDNISTLLDSKLDTKKYGEIIIKFEGLNIIKFRELIFYYTSINGSIYEAFTLNKLDGELQIGDDINNRMIIDLYEIQPNLKAKFRLTSPTSHVFRHMSRRNFMPFQINPTSLKFTDSLSFLSHLKDFVSKKSTLELTKGTIIPNNGIVVSYDSKYYKNISGLEKIADSIFDTEGLEYIPNKQYYVNYKFNNKEIIIMSNSQLYLLGKDIPEVSYENSASQYLLVIDDLKGGENPKRSVSAISVTDFVDKFVNTVTLWDPKSKYSVGSLVKSPLNSNIYKCVKENISENPVYRDPSGEVINLNAGEYWISGGDLPIGSEVVLHVSKESLNKLLPKYLDCYICVGHELEKNSSFPSWSYTQQLLGDSLEEVTLNIDNVEQSRLRSKFNSDKGRYNRIIPGNIYSGLHTRDHGVASNVKFQLPRIRGQFGRFNSYVVNFYNSIIGEFMEALPVTQGWNGLRSGAGDDARSISFDSYRVPNGDRTGEILEGNSAPVTRGDEIDKYYLIKIR